MPTPQQKKRRRKNRSKERDRRAEAATRPKRRAVWPFLQRDSLVVVSGAISVALLVLTLGLEGSLELALMLHLSFFSVIAGVLFSVDQRLRRAGTGRVSRFNMLAMSLLGGAAGALLAMLLTGHLSDRARFRTLVPGAFLVHMVLIAMV